MIKTLIIAPHVDDELIGCYPVLKRFMEYGKNDLLDVVWLYEASNDRLAEGRGAALFLGFRGFTCTPESLGLLITSNQYDQVYVPARQDWHADHKKANTLARQYATHFYSVDMFNGKPLAPADRDDKKRLLDQFYPSQKKLWANDAKYYLFSAISEVDYLIYETLIFQSVSITVLREYAYNVNDYVRYKMGTDLQKAFNDIVALCPVGEVTLHINTGVTYKI